jgi:hypothetical protein
MKRTFFASIVGALAVAACSIAELADGPLDAQPALEAGTPQLEGGPASDASTDAPVDALVIDASDAADGEAVRLPTCGVNVRVSVATDGTQGNAKSEGAVAISTNGRFVAFVSAASNLVPSDINGTKDVFVRDLLTGVTEVVSVASDGAFGNGPSGNFAGGSTAERIGISDDGRFVVFTSDATNLVPNDTNATADVFLRDRVEGTTELVSVNTNGTQITNGGTEPTVSDDGRYVVFTGPRVRDRLLNTTTLYPGNGFTRISADGTTMAYIAASAADPFLNVFTMTLATGAVEKMSKRAGNNGNTEHELSISDDGNLVLYRAPNASIAAIGGSGHQLYIADRAAGTNTALPSFDGLVMSYFHLSGNGRYVFASTTTKLDPMKDANSAGDLYSRDLQTNTWNLASRGMNGSAGGAFGYFDSTADGAYVAFASTGTNLVAGDTNAFTDVFVARANCP